MPVSRSQPKLPPKPQPKKTLTSPQKGQQTKAAIVDAALGLAAQIGLEGLSIGVVADAMQMSKSGVFAHFGSREELQKYTASLSSYPLPLDIGLPLFSWQVLFRNNSYTGLIENMPYSILQTQLFERKGNRYRLLKDSIVEGYALQKDDILRDEQIDFKELLSTAAIINGKLKNTPCRVSFYHLDSVILKKYSLHELETVFNSLR